MAESPNCCSVWALGIHCLYSCHWRKCPKERMKTSQCECIWFGLLFFTVLLSLGWLYIGLILLNDLHNFNECVMDPSASANVSTYSPPWDPWVLSHPQPCPALLLPNILTRPLHEISPVLGVPDPVKGCPSLPSSPPSGSTYPNSPQATPNTPSCTRKPPSPLPQIPVPPLGTLDGLVPGIYAFRLSTGHICVPATAPGCAPVVLWPASTSAWCPQGRVGMGASGKGGSWVQHLAGYLLKISLFYPRAQTQDLKPSKCLLNERRKVEESGDWKGPVFIE